MRTQFPPIFPLLLIWSSVASTLGGKATQPPCCEDELGSNVCSRLSNSQPSQFRSRCLSEADFRLIQCCGTCETTLAGQTGDDYNSVAAKLADAACFDRRSHTTCNGNGRLAFRVCRRSCGYCNDQGLAATVTYTLTTAQAVCNYG